MARDSARKQLGRSTDGDYRRYISNIAYRFGFEVLYEEGRISKIEDGVKSVVIETNCLDHSLDWKAWRKLSDEYDFSGIWNNMATDERIAKSRAEEAEGLEPAVDYWNQMVEKLT